MASNKINIVITASDQASKPLRKVSSEIDSTSDSASRFNGLMAGAGKVALAAGAAGFAALTTGAVAASKASYDQVKAVEEARFGLAAYEKDASKVEKVLDGLVTYAKSDMGVLFNRKDMFAAASTLKMYGNETETLDERVKILSKGVAQGKTTFQELSAIVGRAAAKGRLDAVDFDMLIERGIGLDRSFRGSKVSAEKLWTALNKALPDELLKGRADTIAGRMIRMQSAFRGVGDQILGVDSKTSKFIEGGIGDRFQKAVGTATQLLKGAAPAAGDLTSRFLELLDGSAKVGREVGEFLSPKLEALWQVVETKLTPTLKRLWREVIEPLAPVVGTVLVGALGLAIDALGWTLATVSDLVNFVGDNWEFLSPFIAAFAGLAASMAIGAAFTAFSGMVNVLAVTTIPAAITKMAALKLLVSTPMVMPAIAIGAALAGLAVFKRAIDGIADKIAQINDDKQKIARMNDDIANIQKAKSDLKAGKISQDTYNGLIRIYGKADGSNAAEGGWTRVGEHGPEIINMPQGAQVIPAYRSRSESSAPSARGVVVNMNGPININNGGDYHRLLSDIGFALETAS